MMRLYQLFLLFSLSLVSCGAEEIDFSKLESSQRSYEERLRQTNLTFMSIETMFPDPQVRALAAAAAKGNISQINELVSQGVDVNARGTQNATPVFWAMQNLAGFTRLLELGADPNIVYEDGSTILHLAVRTIDTSLLETALKHGADPNIVTYSLKQTPLFSAIGAPSGIKVMNILLDAGAEMEARNKYGNTPLITAAVLARLEQVYLLLTRGANYRITNRRGISMMDYIADYRPDMVPGSDGFQRLEKVVGWLEERGVEIPKRRLKEKYKEMHKASQKENQ